MVHFRSVDFAGGTLNIVLTGMEECEYATGEAIFEAKARDEIRTGVRGRRVDLFTSGRCIRSGGADAGRAADAKHCTESRQSRLVKRKSPTSAWRRSMCSTRRIRLRPGVVFSSPGAAAVAAEAAGVAEAAEAAVDAVDAAQLLSVVGRLPHLLDRAAFRLR